MFIELLMLYKRPVVVAFSIFGVVYWSVFVTVFFSLYLFVAVSPTPNSENSVSVRVIYLFPDARLSLGHPGSLTSVHDLKCMRTQTAPLFNVPRGRRGTTTRVVHPYPHGTSRTSNPGRCGGSPEC